MDLYKIQKKVSKRLPIKKFTHTLGVQTTCFSLAILYGEDYNKAIYAGLFHDLAKYMSNSKLLNECKKHKLPISKTEKKNPHLLHGKLGAYYAKEEFNIKDKDVLNAIAYHTTGRPNMSLLEKIVFVADYIEPNRSEKDNPSLANIRQLAFRDIDKAVFETLKATLNYLNTDNNEDNKKKIDSNSIKAYNYYKIQE